MGPGNFLSWQGRQIFLTIAVLETTAARNPWPGCDPQRYNVDGPVERLLNKGVTQIILVDLTVGGVRFSKTYDIFKKVKLCLSDNGQGAMPVKWLNDPNNLMQNSYPTDPGRLDAPDVICKQNRPNC